MGRTACTEPQRLYKGALYLRSGLINKKVFATTHTQVDFVLLLTLATTHVAIVVLTLGRRVVEVCNGYTLCLLVK
jgi:hypothetical protein